MNKQQPITKCHIRIKKPEIYLRKKTTTTTQP